MLLNTKTQNLLFKISPRLAHLRFSLALRALKNRTLYRPILKLRYRYKSDILQTKVFGITFANPVGLASGLDSNGRFIDELSLFGFSFVEFESDDIDSALKNIKETGQNIVKVASFGPYKTKDLSPADTNEIAARLRRKFSLMYDFADIFVIRIEDNRNLLDIIDPILDTRICYDSYKSLIISQEGDISDSELEAVLKSCMLLGIDGIRVDAKKISKIKSLCASRIHIIATGDISTPEQALSALDDGADLLELKQEVIKENPIIVKHILKRLDKHHYGSHSK